MSRGILAEKASPASDRRRFQRAVGALWELGIVALGPIRADAARSHEILRDHVARNFPGGTGSYLFWTAADERAFGRKGMLAGTLTIHCSGREVADAAVSVFQDHGVDAALPPAPDTVLVFPPAIGPRGS